MGTFAGDGEEPRVPVAEIVGLDLLSFKSLRKNDLREEHVQPLGPIAENIKDHFQLGGAGTDSILCQD